MKSKFRIYSIKYPLALPSPSLLFSSKTQRIWQRPSFRSYSAGLDKGQHSSPNSRAERILAQLPNYMRRYTRRLQTAPVSHVVAFLILHEITAIIPLFGLVGLFHYTNYVPIDYMMDHFGGQATEGVRRFENYFRRKGWFGFEAEDGVVDGRQTKTFQNAADGVNGASSADGGAVLERWKSTDAKYKIVVEVGLAYAITKVLLPVRIVASLSATPWFAGVLVRLRGLRGPPKRK